MNLLDGNAYLARKETIQFMSEKTGLNISFIYLIEEVFVFIIKKLLFEHGKVKIYNLGILIIRIYRKKKYIKNYKVSFFAGDYYKEMLRGTRKPTMIKKIYKPFRDRLEVIGEVLGIKKEDMRFLFLLYVYCINVYSCKHNGFRFGRLGNIYFHDCPHFKNHYFSKVRNKEGFTKVATFRLTRHGYYEIARKIKKIILSDRLKRIFYFSNIDTSIPLRPKFVEENDLKSSKINKYSRINNDFKKTKSRQ